MSCALARPLQDVLLGRQIQVAAFSALSGRWGRDTIGSLRNVDNIKGVFPWSLKPLINPFQLTN